MWKKKFSKIYPNIDKKKVWHNWADVNNWTSWHDDIDYCKLDGEFAENNSFLLKPKGAPEVRIEIIELIPYKKFVDCTKFFGAKMYDIHTLEDTKDGLRISNELIVKGPLAFLWVLLVAKNVAASTPKETDNLVRMSS